MLSVRHPLPEHYAILILHDHAYATYIYDTMCCGTKVLHPIAMPRDTQADVCLLYTSPSPRD